MDCGAALSVTVAPVLIGVVLMQGLGEVVAEVIVQLIPPVPVTVPLPVLPVAFTVTVVALKAAVTDWLPLIVTTHAPLPLQVPPQPAKAVPAGAFGVSVTELP